MVVVQVHVVHAAIFGAQPGSKFEPRVLKRDALSDGHTFPCCCCWFYTATTSMIPTPDLSHLTSKDYDLVYEPAGPSAL